MGKILVIDDSETIRSVMSGSLEKASYEVLVADSGEKGLDYIYKDNDITLVFLDINMPGISGIQVLEKLKATPPKNLPNILMLSTETEESVIRHAKELGAKGYLIKPIERERLLITADAYA